MWQNITNGIIGLGVIALAFLGLTGTTLVWTLVLAGVVIAILGFWGAADVSNGAGATTKTA